MFGTSLFVLCVGLGLAPVVSPCTTCQGEFLDAVMKETSQEQCVALNETYLPCVKNAPNCNKTEAEQQVKSICSLVCYEQMAPCTNLTLSATDDVDQNCRLYQQVVQCLQVNVTGACQQDENIRLSLSSMQQAAQQMCDSKCAVSLYQCTSLLNYNSSSQTSSSSCGSNLQTHCSDYQQVLECVAHLSAECQEQEQFQITQMRNGEAQLCGPESSCMHGLQSCLCEAMKDQAPASPADTCRMLQQLGPCFDNVPTSCAGAPDNGMNYARHRLLYDVYQYLYCDPNGGVCPTAVQCLKHLETPRTTTTTTTTSTLSPAVQGFPPPVVAESRTEGSGLSFPFAPPPMPQLGLMKLCTTPAVMDCLAEASETCSIDQGNTTFQQVKTMGTDMCFSFIPHWERLEQCDDFLTCVANFDKIAPMEQLMASSTEPPSADVIRNFVHVLASATRTGFWCSYLDHVYQCGIDAPVTCSLQDIKSLMENKRNNVNQTCQGALSAGPVPTPAPVEVKTTKKPDDKTGGVETLRVPTIGITTMAAILVFILKS